MLLIYVHALSSSIDRLETYRHIYARLHRTFVVLYDNVIQNDQANLKRVTAVTARNDSYKNKH